MFKVGDKVKFNGCPFDEQITEEVMMYNFLATQTMKVIRVSKPDDLDVPATDEVEPEGRWIITDLTTDWIDQAWFKKID